MSTSVEIHLGCGGIVKLRHEVWQCQKCGQAPIPTTATRLRRSKP